MTRAHGRYTLALACAGLLVLAWVGDAAQARRVARARASASERAAALPQPRTSGGFVGSDACRSCHVELHASWRASWHRTMTQAVAPTTVIAQFDGRTLAHPDGAHAVERRGDEYWVRMPEPSALLARAEQGADAVAGSLPFAWQRVVMSTGAHNMQMYWVAAAPGRRLIAFPFTWVVEGQTWVANEATLLRPREPHVVYGWNEVCLQCHAVAGSPGMREEAGALAVESEVAELGIACEACHGPGDAHVRARRSPLVRYAEHLRGDPLDDVVNPARLDGAGSSEICGQCHSASVFEDHVGWLGRGSDYRAGGSLDATTRIVRHPLRADQPWIDELLDRDPDYLAGRFWGDGMMRISGREYNGWLESPCRADASFGCLSCHEMHGDRPEDQLRDMARFDDDRQCTHCHATLAADHTRHAPDSPGSRCVNCHMPHTVYGLTKAIRSHEISSPSVAESVEIGRPNACNLCHLDRSLAWTAQVLASWGLPQVTLEPDTPGVARAAAAEWLVRGDAGQRALAAWAMGWADAQASSGRDYLAPLLVQALADEYDAVRWVALRSLRSLSGYEDLDWTLATTALDDAARAELLRRFAGSERRDAALYLDASGAFDLPAWAADHARRDTRIVDLRE
jgi:hypothetical protein